MKTINTNTCPYEKMAYDLLEETFGPNALKPTESEVHRASGLLHSRIGPLLENLKVVLDAVNEYRQAHSEAEAINKNTSRLNDAYAHMLLVCDKSNDSLLRVEEQL